MAPIDPLGRAPADSLEWARHPRSQAAFQLLRKGAKENRQLREIFKELIESGVGTDNGILLFRWIGHKWVKNT